MPVSLKVDDYLAVKAEGLIRYLQNEDAVRVIGSKYNRNDVLRMALVKGLDVLERELVELETDKERG